MIECRRCGIEKPQTEYKPRHRRCKDCMKAKYDTRPKNKLHRDFGGQYKMRKYSKQEVLEHLQHLKDSPYFDYSFLFTNPKLN